MKNNNVKLEYEYFNEIEKLNNSKTENETEEEKKSILSNFEKNLENEETEKNKQFNNLNNEEIEFSNIDIEYNNNLNKDEFETISLNKNNENNNQIIQMKKFNFQNINLKSKILKTDEILIFEIFNQILNEIIKNHSNFGTDIKEIINNSNNLQSIIEYFSNNIYFLFSNTKQNINNLKNKYEKNEFLDYKNNIRRAFQDSDEKSYLKEKSIFSNNITLEDLKISSIQRKTFDKILEQLNMNNHFKYIMNLRERTKLRKKYTFVKSNVGEAMIIPDNNGNKYKFAIKDISVNMIGLKCSEPMCKGKANIKKNDLSFKLRIPHSIPYEQHHIN